MKTQDTLIYHCMSCGAISHCAPVEETPLCCGREMVKALTLSEIINDGSHAATTSPHFGPRSPQECGSSQQD